MLLDLEDDAPTHPMFIDAFKSSFMTESDLHIQRDLIRQRFWDHYEDFSTTLKAEGKESFKAWRTTFDSDVRKREQADSKLLCHIHDDIIENRKKQLKKHAKKWTKHELNVKLRLKDLLFSVQQAKAKDDVILDKLKVKDIQI